MPTGTELLYLRCRGCGEVFDENALDIALEHSKTEPQQTEEEFEGWDLVTEEDAFS